MKKKEKKPWENVQCILVSKLYPDFFLLLYHFHQFWYNATNTFGKVYLTSKLLVSEKVINSGRLMLVCRWVGVNAPAQNKFRPTIDLLNQHLLAESHHQWNQQLNVLNLLKVNNKDTRLMSLTSFWSPNYYLQTHFPSCSSIFSASIFNFEQVKFLLGSRSHRSKKPRYLLLLVENVEKRKKRNQRWTQNLWHI